MRRGGTRFSGRRHGIRGGCGDCSMASGVTRSRSSPANGLLTSSRGDGWRKAQLASSVESVSGEYCPVCVELTDSSSILDVV